MLANLALSVPTARDHTSGRGRSLFKPYLRQLVYDVLVLNKGPTMKLSKRMMLPMAAIAMLGAAAVGTTAVSAATNGQPGTLAQKLASTFNLDPAKVQSVIDQNHNDMEQKHQAAYEERLNQAVTDGKLTAAQKQAILDENAKLKAELDAAKDKTPAERRSAMKSVRQGAKDWAKAQNIDEKWLIGGGRHPRGGMMHDDQPEASPNASPSA